MNRAKNRRLLLVRRPDGMIRAEDFRLVDESIPPLAEGQFLVRNHFASIDPAMRGWLDDKPSYLPPVALGAVMRAGTVGQIIESRAAGFSAGDWIKGIHGIEEWSLGVEGDGSRLVDPAKVHSMSEYISVVGGAALTAWVAVNRILVPQPGETLLVSSAAGGVGAVAVQLAARAGATVIGIAGGPEKCRRLTEELGCVSAIDHRGKQFRDFRHAIAAAAPDGLDMVLENVGGDGLDGALANLRQHARVALCGLLSEYNAPPVGARNLRELIYRSVTMRGFTLLDFPDAIAPATEELLACARNGSMQFAVEIIEGIDNAYGAMEQLFIKGSDGKLVLKIY